MRIVLKACRIGAAAAVLLAMSLLAWQCLDIVSAGSTVNTDAGGQPVQALYTREDVAARLKSLSVPLAVCAAVVIAAVILSAAAGEQPSETVGISPENRLRLIRARVRDLPEAALREEKLCRRLNLIEGGVLMLAGACCLRYLLDGGSFPPWDSVSPDAAVGNLLRRLALPAAMAGSAAIGFSFARSASVRREIELLREAPKDRPAAPEPPKARTNPARAILYAAAVVFIVLGVMNGGARDVLYKAINICTECIGLG